MEFMLCGLHFIILPLKYEGCLSCSIKYRDIYGCFFSQTVFMYNSHEKTIRCVKFIIVLVSFGLRLTYSSVYTHGMYEV